LATITTRSASPDPREHGTIKNAKATDNGPTCSLEIPVKWQNKNFPKVIIGPLGASFPYEANARNVLAAPPQSTTAISANAQPANRTR